MVGACECPSQHLSTLQQCAWRGSEAQRGEEVEEEAVGMVPMLESRGLAQDKWLPHGLMLFKRALCPLSAVLPPTYQLWC